MFSWLCAVLLLPPWMAPLRVAAQPLEHRVQSSPQDPFLTPNPLLPDPWEQMPLPVGPGPSTPPIAIPKPNIRLEPPVPVPVPVLVPPVIEPARPAATPAPVPKAAEKSVQEPSIQQFLEEPLRAVAPWLAVRHDGGDGVGYDDGFTYFETFVPLAQSSSDDVLFTDLRVMNFDDAALWEWNVGLGYRWLSHDGCRIYGASVFYDGRHSTVNVWDQIGFGLEVLGDVFDARANFYLVLGDEQQQRATPARTLRETALSGFDVEFGAAVPGLKRWDVRAYLGYYYYSGEGLPQMHGVRGRLEGWLTRNVAWYCTVQNDTLFDTTVSGGLAVYLGGNYCESCSLQQRLGARIVRNNVVLFGQ